MSDREPWAKPLDAPSLGIDLVSHLARRRPADPALARLITVRVQDGPRDGEELLLPLGDVETVLERARRFRALQWPEFGTPDQVIQDILVHVNDSPLVMRMPDGWIEVGKIGDSWAGPYWLRVAWQEWNDRVQVARPPAPKELPVPKSPDLGPPLYRAGGNDPNLLRRPFIAHAGYIYSHEGREYAPYEAERMAAKLGSLDGWTWRHELFIPPRPAVGAAEDVATATRALCKISHGNPGKR